MEYFSAMLTTGVPNIEMHIYGNGRHPGDALSDGSRMTGGLTDRNGIPFGAWQHRYVDWFRDLGFLQKPGVETKAAKDIAAFLAQPPLVERGGRSGRPGAGNPSGATPQPANP
jgi:endo-1,4-beta-xylanase